METSFRIRERRIAELDERIVKLNKRAAKLGLPGLGYTVTKREIVPILDESTGLPSGRVKVFVHVQITGTVPVVSDHQFLASIQHETAGNIIAKAPGVTDEFQAYWTAKPKCEHCNLARRRNDTFLLRTPQGEIKQIGRNCLADYLRTTDVEAAIRAFSLINDLDSFLHTASSDDEDSSGGYGPTLYGVTDVVATTLSVIRHRGWVSSTKAREEGGAPTAEVVKFAMEPPHPSESEKTRKERAALAPTPEDGTKAEAIVAWVKTLVPTDDYRHNLQVACGLGYIEAKNVALVASSVIAYGRDVEAMANRGEKTDAGHFGEVGKRYDLSLKVKFVRHTESDWGVSTLIAMEDAEGHEFKWFASGSHNYEPGTACQVRGTVKKHDEYKGHKQTVLSRCTIKTESAS